MVWSCKLLCARLGKQQVCVTCCGELPLHGLACLGPHWSTWSVQQASEHYLGIDEAVLIWVYTLYDQPAISSDLSDRFSERLILS